MQRQLLCLALLLVTLSGGVRAQATPNLFEIEDDDLNVTADIFSDYSEDLESNQVLEDERFFKYGRFFTFSLRVGNTALTGLRGSAQESSPPTFGIAVAFFLNFRMSYELGVEYSKHSMLIENDVNGFGVNIPGAINISYIRPYLSLRYHIDTADLGTALTWSNPYFVGRIEYWYQKSRFIDTDTIEDQSGGGLGLGLGAGLEFPLVLKEYYFGVEMLYHVVNFFDERTENFRPNFENLEGDAFSLMSALTISW